ncbi:hypothetical protein OG496_50835 [Streptomyces sp. NBC_00988]|uniref:hypothetical protein n=1 Tax=Streptomyces sp. NBC_00988 TaxID=2903704 RepID=UPI00386887CA|nr:hypothetical protein OG496_50835 [Streptomyces sp. NBC_00988]
MATPRSAGRTLAVPERTGRTTHDRDPADPATTDRSAAFRMTGHGRPDRAGAVGLDVCDTPRSKNAKKPNTPHAKNTLPHHNGIAGDRRTRPVRPTLVA